MNTTQRLIASDIEAYMTESAHCHIAASGALRDGNYSEAATYCHRAYQWQLRAEALQKVLDA